MNDIQCVNMSSDHIAGLIFGHALGDMYGGKRHDWAVATAQLLMTIDSIISRGMRIDIPDIVARMQRDLARVEADGDPTLVHLLKVTSDTNFASRPARVAYAARETSNNPGSLARAAALAILGPRAIDVIPKITLVTHQDSRAVAAGVLYAHVLWGIINADWRQDDSGTAAPYSMQALDMMLSAAIRDANIWCPQHEPELAKAVMVGYTQSTTDIELGEPTIAKSISAGMFALRVIRVAVGKGTVPSFKKTIDSIRAAGGSAEDCAVAGSIIGAHLGYSRLPSEGLVAMSTVPVGECMARLSQAMGLARKTADSVPVAPDTAADVPKAPADDVKPVDIDVPKPVDVKPADTLVVAIDVPKPVDAKVDSIEPGAAAAAPAAIEVSLSDADIVALGMMS